MSKIIARQLTIIGLIGFITWSTIALYLYKSSRYSQAQIVMSHRVSYTECWKVDLLTCQEATDAIDGLIEPTCDWVDWIGKKPDSTCMVKDHCLEWKEVCPKCNQFIINPFNCVMDWALKHCANGVCEMNYVNLTSCTDYQLAQTCKCEKVCVRRPVLSKCNTNLTPDKCIDVFRWPIYQTESRMTVPHESIWYVNTSIIDRCDYNDQGCINRFVKSWPYNETAYIYSDPQSSTIADLTKKQYNDMENRFHILVSANLATCILLSGLLSNCYHN